MSLSNLLSPSTRRTETITLPEVGEVKLRELDGEQWERFQMDVFQRGEAESAHPRFRALLTTYTIVDDNGNPVFGPDAADAIAQQPTRIVKPLYEAVIRVNGMSREDSEKNSESGQ